MFISTGDVKMKKKTKHYMTGIPSGVIYIYTYKHCSLLYFCCVVFTCIWVTGHSSVLHVVTVVLAPGCVRTLLQRELISCALYPVQQDGPSTGAKMRPRPCLWHTTVFAITQKNTFIPKIIYVRQEVGEPCTIFRKFKKHGFPYYG